MHLDEDGGCVTQATSPRRARQSSPQLPHSSVKLIILDHSVSFRQSNHLQQNPGDPNPKVPGLSFVQDSQLKRQVGTEVQSTFPSSRHESWPRTVAWRKETWDLFLIYPPTLGGNILCASSGQNKSLAKISHILTRITEGNKMLPGKVSKCYLGGDGLCPISHRCPS